MHVVYQQPGYDLRYSDDGSLLLCIGRTVRLLNTRDRKWLWTNQHILNPSHGSFSPSQRMLAIKNTKGRIFLLRTNSGELRLDLKNHLDGEGCEVHFSPDGREIIDGSWKGSLIARNCRTGTLKFRAEFAFEMIERIATDAQRKTWLFLHHPKQNPDLPPSSKPTKAYIGVREWPFSATEHIHRPIEHIGQVALHPNGETYCYSQVLPTHHLCVANTATHATVSKSHPIEDDRIRDLAWSWEGEIIAAVQRHAGFVFYRSSDLAVIGMVPAKYASSVAFRPGSDEVALGTWNETAIVQLKDILLDEIRLGHAG
jgi:WD40 repeat protein